MKKAPLQGNITRPWSGAGGVQTAPCLTKQKICGVSVPRPDTGRWESAGRIVLGADFSLAWRCIDAQYWGITFEEPYIVPEKANRTVAYASREALERNLPQPCSRKSETAGSGYPVTSRGGITHAYSQDNSKRSRNSIKAFEENEA